MKRILIVEDDKSMHEVYKDIFIETEERYSLIFVINVKEALQKLNKERIDLVVLDIIMEPISGEYLYLKLRRDKKFKSKGIPVIVVSVMKRQSLEHLRKINNISLLEKPIRCNRFLRKVEKMVGGVKNETNFNS